MKVKQFKAMVAQLHESFDDLEIYFRDVEGRSFGIKVTTILPCKLVESEGGPEIGQVEALNPQVVIIV